MQRLLSGSMINGTILMSFTSIIFSQLGCDLVGHLRQRQTFLLYAIGILVSLTPPALPLNQIGGVWGGGGQKHKGLSVLSFLSISLKLCRFGAVVDNFAGFVSVADFTKQLTIIRNFSTCLKLHLRFISYKRCAVTM